MVLYFESCICIWNEKNENLELLTFNRQTKIWQVLQAIYFLNNVCISGCVSDHNKNACQDINEKFEWTSSNSYQIYINFEHGMQEVTLVIYNKHGIYSQGN